MMRQLLSVFSLCMLVLLLLAQQGCSQRSDSKATIETFKQLQEKFRSPGKEYGSAPLWVWHTKVTKTIIDSMMQEFQDQSFGGIMVHPRPGLITDYLSDDWNDLFQYTVQKGKELGLNVWIYDENSYPAGMAGGLVPDQMPESFNQGQMLHLTKTDTFPTRTDSIFIALKESNGAFINITDKIAEEKGKQGHYFLFSKEYYRKGASTIGPPEFPYVDLMAKGVTEKFLEVTMKGYEKVAGEDFGKTVPGLFSDEPNIMTQGAGNIRWTPDLFSTFEKMWGYDLKNVLPSLFEDLGDWKKIRHNYWQTLLQLFIDRWSKPMHDYMEKHNLVWTGHYWEHEWPRPWLVPDNMAMYAWHKMPGIDMLFNQFNEESTHAQFGNIRSVKELSSVANQLGRERTLSETYGGGGWELTFKDMKRLADWQYVLGVNFLNQHLSMMTLTGVRKYDYPQSFSYHTPWWPYYKTLNEYFTRISFAMSQGKQHNDILVLEPTTSAWMYVAPGKNYEEFSSLGNHFQQFVTTLEKAQVEYDLGSEYILRNHGKTEGKTFVVGERAYRTVVIPPGMENMDKATGNMLKAYTDAGGKLIVFDTPKRIDGALNNELGYLTQSNDHILRFTDLNSNVIREHFSLPDFQIQPFGDSSIGGNLFHHRRKMKDGQILFLANASMESVSKGSITTKGKDALLLDAATGEVLDYQEEEQSGMITLRFEIPPAGSLLFFMADQKQQLPKSYQPVINGAVIQGTALQTFRPVENTLMIDFCDLRYADSLLKDAHVEAASNIIFKHYGFDRDPWERQVQFKTNFIDRDTFSAGTGYTATYHFNIDKQVNFEQFRAVVEQGSLWKEIRVNDKPIKPLTNTWWLDRSYGVLNIGELLKPGDNTLSVSTDPMSVFAELGPVYILGNFNLSSAAKGWQITAPQPMQQGSWKQQGLPMYAFGIRYAKNFELGTTGSRYELQLGEWKGTVATVKVNGQEAGIIFSEPNTLDVSKFLKSGTNNVEIEVIGSLKNLLGPHYNHPIPGMVGPNHWANIQSYPPGKDYDTYDYGLIGDVIMVEYK